MRTHTLMFFKGSSGDHRWRLIHWNGQVVGGSTEGYVRRIDAERNAQLVTRYRLRPSIRVAYETTP